MYGTTHKKTNAKHPKHGATKTRTPGKTVTYKVVSVIPFGPYVRERALAVRMGLARDKSIKVSGLTKVRGGYGLKVTAVSYQKYPAGVTPVMVKSHMKQQHPDVKCTVTRANRK